jgi:hypothetical protein
MRFNVYGFAFETPEVRFYLWSPWRAAALEHRLFEAIGKLPHLKVEERADELVISITDTKTARSAVRAVERVIKGWQEDGDPGSERRRWCWMIEGDTDSNGYDHMGEVAAIWGFLRIILERGGLDEPSRQEHIDLDNFGFEVLPTSDER